MARHVTKASWTATEASHLGHDVARALGLAKSGRLGPVHIGLPVDVLESEVDRPGDSLPQADDFQKTVGPIETPVAEQVLDALAKAQRPLVLAGPMMMRGAGPGIASSLAEEIHMPVVCMESPRGMNDPSRDLPFRLASGSEGSANEMATS